MPRRPSPAQRNLIQDWKPGPLGGAGNECDADGAPSGDEVESGLAVAAEAPPEASVLEPPATPVAPSEARTDGEGTGLTGACRPRATRSAAVPSGARGDSDGFLPSDPEKVAADLTQAMDNSTTSVDARVPGSGCAIMRKTGAQSSPRPASTGARAAAASLVSPAPAVFVRSVSFPKPQGPNRSVEAPAAATPAEIRGRRASKTAFPRGPWERGRGIATPTRRASEGVGLGLPPSLARRVGVLAGAAERGADPALTALATWLLGCADEEANRSPIEPEKSARQLTQPHRKISTSINARVPGSAGAKTVKPGRTPRQIARKGEPWRRTALARAKARRRLTTPLRRANASPATAMPGQGFVAAVGRQPSCPRTFSLGGLCSGAVQSHCLTANSDIRAFESRASCTQDEIVTYRGGDHGHG